MRETKQLKPVTKKLKGVSLKKAPKKRPPKKKISLSPWPVIALVAVLISGIGISWFITVRDFGTGAKIPSGYKEFCVDVSHHNGEIVWDSLRLATLPGGRTTRDLKKATAILPISRIILKATEGASLTDDRFDAWWAEAGAIDIQRGAYHFFRSSKDARTQAEHYIAHVKLRSSDLPPVLDVETIHLGCTDKQLCDGVLTWLEIVEKHYGRKPIVYTGDSFARDHLSADITEHYPLWIARYNELPPVTEDWTMWQFTDKAVVHGIKGHADLSVIRP